jgi:NAD+ kinase
MRTGIMHILGVSNPQVLCGHLFLTGSGGSIPYIMGSDHFEGSSGRVLVIRVGLVSRLDGDDALKVALRLYKGMARKDLKVLPEEQLSQVAKLPGGVPFSKMDADLIVTVGGDGTVLKTCMGIPKPETPILAVNMGRRGYLTEVDPENAMHAIESYIKGTCKREEHAKLSITVEGETTVDGLNEAVITSGTPSKMLHFMVSIDKSQLLEFRGDGLIVSTPTGSTAYSLSAGGPIVDNSVEAFVVTFICPLEHLTPLVLSMDNRIKVELMDPKLKGTLVVDGRLQRELHPQTSVTITRSPHKAVFVRLGPIRSLRGLMRLRPTPRNTH